MQYHAYGLLEFFKKAFQIINRPVLPSRGSELPAPAQNLKITHVVIGRGTQNYSCSAKSESKSPVLVGALATLYDASCLSTINPSGLDDLTAAVLKVDRHGHAVDDIISRSLGSILVAGSHYFVGGSPFFDFRKNGATDYAKAKSIAQVPAPTSPDDVDWLKLEKTDGSGVQVCFGYLCSVCLLSGLFIYLGFHRKFIALKRLVVTHQKHARMRARH